MDTQMSKTLSALFIVMLSVMLQGCQSFTAQNTQKTNNLTTEAPAIAPKKDASIIIFNNSNQFLFGKKGTGKLNLIINNNEKYQLEIGQYIKIEAPHGPLKIQLKHTDLFDFDSLHQVNITKNAMYIEVFATMTSNGLTVTNKPDNFNSQYQITSN
ncbi:MAG TPA: hypothetical protein DHW71_07170 [Gammaproteobacteria bacterium]|nr:hypothetical protein [Gammaproteobacteria bacterium]MEC8012366.1 hypothetical protein [Pseudomonadota bacterium]HBF08269.1 hypothetical protein [Gammaproteobacteria bacterium]HCK92748.1 hypothetical protein [Gammaproteobacteria bacterium]|tara:strand:- start:781 stop:1248 length:468 start_codon:yes stop_codon:yes gene_type:complete